MPHQPLASYTTVGADDVADQAIVVAQTALYVAQVERTCGLDGCLPNCRVRDSLRRSLESERAYLAELANRSYVNDSQECSLPNIDLELAS